MRTIVPPFIALTGGIGAGKTTALRELEKLGAAVLSSDVVVHELYDLPAVKDAVTRRFGAEVLADGVVDRGALARAAFRTPADREWLEQLIWPLVRQRTAAWRERVAASVPAPRALVVEVPLLFESGGEDRFDATIAITADDALRLARAGTRGHEEFRKRDARQLNQEQKAARATFVVANNGDVSELSQKLSDVLAMLEP